MSILLELLYNEKWPKTTFIKIKFLYLKFQVTWAQVYIDLYKLD